MHSYLLPARCPVPPIIVPIIPLRPAWLFRLAAPTCSDKARAQCHCCAISTLRRNSCAITRCLGLNETEDVASAGGFTRNGEVDSLHEQALSPLLNPNEMTNANPIEIAAKLKNQLCRAVPERLWCRYFRLSRGGAGDFLD